MSTEVPLHAKPLEELLTVLVDECIDDMQPQRRAAKVADVTVAIDTLVRGMGGNMTGYIERPVWHDHHEWNRRQLGSDYPSNETIEHDHNGKALNHLHDDDGQIQWFLDDEDEDGHWMNCPDYNQWVERCDECGNMTRMDRHRDTCSLYVEDEVNAARASA